MAAPPRLYGLKALVTSAANGIGEASARTLVKHGAKVLAVDTINSGVEQHFQSVKGIDGYSFNLKDAARMPALIEDAVERLGGIDILINDFPLHPDAPLILGGSPPLKGFYTTSLALSPDVRYLAYIGEIEDGSQQLFLRDLTSYGFHPVEGTEGAI